MSTHNLLGDDSESFILRFQASSDFSNEQAREKLVAIHDSLLGSTQAVFSTGHDDFVAAVPESATGCPMAQETQSLKSIRCGAAINMDSFVSVRM